MRKENSFKHYFLTVGVKVEGVVGGVFGFYGTEGYTITCTPALGLEDHLSSSVPQAGTAWVVYGYDTTEKQV